MIIFESVREKEKGRKRETERQDELREKEREVEHGKDMHHHSIKFRFYTNRITVEATGQLDTKVAII